MATEEEYRLFRYNVPLDGVEPSETLDTFTRDGVVVLPQFASLEEVCGMKRRMAELIDAWDPAEAKGSVFHTYGNEKLNQEYFLESAATVKFFLEADAVDKSSGLVKPDFAKSEIINKVGHALHFLDPVFTSYSQSAKVKALVKALGYRDPVLPQSMYIFKQARIGGEVTSHQDSTYLFTTPHQTCLGMWLALDDATLENGCLWARKGSHHEPLRSQLVRRDAADASTDTSDTSTSARGLAKIAPKEVNVDGDDEAGRSSARARQWLGKVPGGSVKYSAAADAALRAEGFVPLPVKAGDLVCFPGTLDHLSLANETAHSRHTFQLHLVEGPGETRPLLPLY